MTTYTRMNIFEIEAAAESKEQIAVLCRNGEYFAGKVLRVGILHTQIHAGLKVTVEYSDGYIDHYSLDDIYRIEN